MNTLTTLNPVTNMSILKSPIPNTNSLIANTSSPNNLQIIWKYILQKLVMDKFGEQ